MTLYLVPFSPTRIALAEHDTFSARTIAKAGPTRPASEECRVLKKNGKDIGVRSSVSLCIPNYRLIGARAWKLEEGFSRLASSSTTATAAVSDHRRFRVCRSVGWKGYMCILVEKSTDGLGMVYRTRGTGVWCT